MPRWMSMTSENGTSEKLLIPQKVFLITSFIGIQITNKVTNINEKKANLFRTFC